MGDPNLGNPKGRDAIQPEGAPRRRERAGKTGINARRNDRPVRERPPGRAARRETLR